MKLASRPKYLPYKTRKRKSAEEWGLPIRSSYYRVDCWICGHLLYSGTQKIHGVQETDAADIAKFQEICSACFQVQMTINRDYLHKGVNSGGQRIVRMFLCEPDMKRIAVWKVLKRKPWIKQIQKLPEKEASP